MSTLIVLFWLLVSPNGDGNLIAKPEPTLEQCQKDGDEMAASSKLAKEAGDIKDFYGACVPLDPDGAKADKRGSI